MIKTVSAPGHTPTSAEEAACLRAAAMLHQEYSLVLDVMVADMIPLILSKIEASIKG